MGKSYGRHSELNLLLWVKIFSFEKYIMRRLSRVISNFGLTPTQFSVMELLFHKGDLTIGEIKKKGFLTGGNITVVVNNLESKGFLETYQDPEDNRKKICALTSEGTELIDKAFVSHLEELNIILDEYTDEEKRKLIKLLNRRD